MGSRRFGLLASFLLVAVSASLGLAPRDAAGANFLVDTTAVDLSDIAPGDGVCAWSTIVPVGQRCSLRAAVAEANALPGADVVVIPAEITITLSNGEIAITSPLAIGSLAVGPGRPVIHANGQSRIFAVTSVPSGAQVRFVNLLLRNGLAPGPSGFDSGGAIRAGAGSYEVSIEGCDLFENVARAGGGAVSASNQTLRISDSTFVGNLVDTAGSAPGAFAVGTAIWASGATATLQIERSSILDNRSVFMISGGAVAVSGMAELRVENSTISGNIDGGIRSDDTDVYLRNVTIADNAEFGIEIGPVVLLDARNTILSDNALSCVFSGGIVSTTASYVLDEDGSCGFFPVGGNLAGVDAKLAALAYNGGPSVLFHTHALLPGSPALDAGNPAAPGSAGACLATDQRGVARPLPSSEGGVARCDMGALEMPEPGAPGLGVAALLALAAARGGRRWAGQCAARSARKGSMRSV